MPMNTVRVVIDSRDRIDGNRNNAKFQIPWDRAIPFNGIKKINVRAHFATQPGLYQTVTVGGVNGPGTRLNGGASVRVRFNAGAESFVTGLNATDDFTFSAVRWGNEFFQFDSNSSLLQLNGPPAGLTHVDVFRGPATSERLVLNNTNNSTTATAEPDMGDYVLVLLFDIEEYYGDIKSNKTR